MQSEKEGKSPVHEDSILERLIILSKKEKQEVAVGIGVDPKYVARLIKSEILTSKVKYGASKYFGVPFSVFGSGDLDAVSIEVNTDYIKLPKHLDDLKHSQERALWAVEREKWAEERERWAVERDRMLGIIEALSRK